MSVSVVLNPQQFDPVVEIVEHWISRPRAYSTTSREGDYSDGYKTAVEYALAAIANDRRCRLYPKFKPLDLPGMNASDFTPFLNTSRKDYLSQVSIADNRKGAVYVWRQDVKDRFTNLVNTPELQQAELQRHRTAVTNGEEAPTVADKKWLQEEANKLEEAANRVRAILNGGSNA